MVFSWSQTIWSPPINTAVSADTGRPAIISINWPQSDMSLMNPAGLGEITLTSTNLGTGEIVKYLVQDHTGDIFIKINFSKVELHVIKI